jgi:hypothetical protein
VRFCHHWVFLTPSQNPFGDRKLLSGFGHPFGLATNHRPFPEQLSDQFDFPNGVWPPKCREAYRHLTSCAPNARTVDRDCRVRRDQLRISNCGSRKSKFVGTGLHQRLPRVSIFQFRVSNLAIRLRKDLRLRADRVGEFGNGSVSRKRAPAVSRRGSTRRRKLKRKGASTWHSVF